jgi:hypothetical protein
MANPLLPARELAYKKLMPLAAMGLRTDKLYLERMPKDTAGKELSWIPSESPSTMPNYRLEYVAPEVKLFQGFGYLAIQESMGVGSIEVGDHVIKLVRTQAIEEFLAMKLIDPDTTSLNPYPEMEWVAFELNGEKFTPVRWLPEALFITIFIRKVA